MLAHWATLCTQPLHATLRACFRATLAYWIPTCTLWLVGFSWASAFRLRRAGRVRVPTSLRHGDGTVAPRSRPRS
eukprot:886201-Pyramimonas_sp.AAC.1